MKSYTLFKLVAGVWVESQKLEAKSRRAAVEGLVDASKEKNWKVRAS